MEDAASLRELIAHSVRVLESPDYSRDQIEGSLEGTQGVDRRLIADGTYYVREAIEGSGEPLLVGCGGWSQRKTLYGSDSRATARMSCSIRPWTLRFALFCAPAMDATWNRDRNPRSVRAGRMRRRVSPFRNDRGAHGLAHVPGARIRRGRADSDSVAQRGFLPRGEARQNDTVGQGLNDLLPEGRVARSEQRVFAGVPAKKMRGAGVRGVVFAAGPDFVEEKRAGLVCAAVQIILQAAFLSARGAKQGAEFGFKQRFLAIPGAKQNDERHGAFRQFGDGWAVPFPNASPPFCGFLCFSFGHDGGDCTPTGRKSNRELSGAQLDCASRPASYSERH